MHDKPKKQEKARQHNRGVALLITILASSMLLLVGTAMATVVLKEALLAETSAESLRAIYAADAGADCILYWDIPRNALDPYVASSVSCFGVTHSFPATVSGLWTSMSAAAWQFAFHIGEYCVDVTVRKSGVPTSTIVQSRGVSTCDTNHPRRVERAIELTY